MAQNLEQRLLLEVAVSFTCSYVNCTGLQRKAWRKSMRWFKMSWGGKPALKSCHSIKMPWHSDNPTSHCWDLKVKSCLSVDLVEFHQRSEAFRNSIRSACVFSMLSIFILFCLSDLKTNWISKKLPNLMSKMLISFRRGYTLLAHYLNQPQEDNYSMNLE